MYCISVDISISIGEFLNFDSMHEYSVIIIQRRTEENVFITIFFLIWLSFLYYQVRLDGKESFFIDGQDPSSSNWMRYVNCARNKEEQNMAAFQHKKKIYYRVVKDIAPGTELLVLYDEDYALDLFAGTSGANFIRMAEDLEQMLDQRRISEEEESMVVGEAADGSHGLFESAMLCDSHAGELVEVDKDQQCSSKQDGSNGEPKCEGEEDNLEGSSDSTMDVQSGGKCKTSNRRLRSQSVSEMGTVSGSLETTALPMSEESDSSRSESSLTCLTCGKHFLSLELLERHIYNFEGSKYKCPLCTEVLASEKSMVEHCKLHDGGKPFVCGCCHKPFVSISRLRTHARVHSGERPHKCSTCQKSFASSSGLYQHLRTHKGDKPYKCDECGKDFRSNGNLQEHARTHTGDKPFKCSFCSKGFGTSSTLKQHLRTHSSEKSFKCELCGKSFTYGSNLSQHRKIHFKKDDKPHECETCGKRFLLSTHLRQHLRMHSGDKPFECEHCHKKFASSSYLLFHVKSHLGEKPFQCSQCQKTFSQKVYLKQHMKMHSDEKAFECEKCGKRFRHRSNLSQHYKVHSEDRPFQCEACGKSFSRRQNLRQHSRIHLELSL